jgi:cytoplasmic iron level regulating protein YaaA (DUF328/UPF0246 family)
MMLVILSPAKKLDWTDVEVHTTTAPKFQNDACYLASVALELDVAGLRKLMSISDDLAALNHARFSTFAARPSAEKTRPAAFAFAGDTYVGLDVRTLDEDAMRWAADHLRILSGLYGLLRPLDRIQPYRLEMGSRLATEHGASLYEYWGDRISTTLNATGRAVKKNILVNCASGEYFGAVNAKALKLDVISPVFLEVRGTEAPKIISFFAKRARGAMARFILENRLIDPTDLRAFSAGGYAYAPEKSTPERPVFLRELPGAG